jgi:predicted benzoate:H+ symporter BenE
MAEGMLFEVLWYRLSFDLKELNTRTLQSSMGIVTSYCVYVGGYIVTQILTPVFSSAGFYLENLVVFIPQILASGLLAAVL